MQLHIMNSCKKKEDTTNILEKKIEELQQEMSIMKKVSQTKQQINNGTINVKPGDPNIPAKTPQNAAIKLIIIILTSIMLYIIVFI